MQKIQEQAAEIIANAMDCANSSRDYAAEFLKVLEDETGTDDFVREAYDEDEVDWHDHNIGGEVYHLSDAMEIIDGDTGLADEVIREYGLSPDSGICVFLCQVASCMREREAYEACESAYSDLKDTVEELKGELQNLLTDDEGEPLADDLLGHIALAMRTKLVDHWGIVFEWVLSEIDGIDQFAEAAELGAEVPEAQPTEERAAMRL